MCPCPNCQAGARRAQAQRWLNEVAFSLLARAPIKAVVLIEQAGNLWASALPLQSTVTH